MASTAPLLSFPSLTTSSEVHSQSDPVCGVDRCRGCSSVRLPSVEAAGARLCGVESLSMHWSNVESGRARAEQSGEGGLKGGGRGGDRRRTTGSKGVPSRLQQSYQKKNFLRLFSSIHSCFSLMRLLSVFTLLFLVCLQMLFTSLYIFPSVSRSWFPFPVLFTLLSLLAYFTKAPSY